VTPDAADIVQVSLIRLGAATHSFDQSARFIPLDFAIPVAGGEIWVASPAQPNLAPPGYYMLFILKDGDRAGIRYPSVAKIIKLSATTP
jgi:hypothetical protein